MQLLCPRFSVQTDTHPPRRLWILGVCRCRCYYRTNRVHLWIFIFSIFVCFKRSATHCAQYNRLRYESSSAASPSLSCIEWRQLKGKISIRLNSCQLKFLVPLKKPAPWSEAFREDFNLLEKCYKFVRASGGAAPIYATLHLKWLK